MSTNPARPVRSFVTQPHSLTVVWRGVAPLASLLLQLVGLLFAVATLLFFLVRLTGDPAIVMAGEYADAATLDALRAKYGLDRSLFVQYWTFIGNALRLDLGTSWVSHRPALELALERVPATLALAASGMLVNLLIAVPLGAYLGASKRLLTRKTLAALVFLAQGVPGYVVALYLIQLFAVEWQLLPSTGDRGMLSWILPSITIASFLAPKLVRVIEVNVSEAMQDEYVTIARAQGASYLELVFRHALPNALLGATALIGAQLALLLNGIIITETIFGWPGVGRLLLDSVLLLDFTVVQSVVLVTTVFVFLANWGADRMIEIVDPRLRVH